MSDNVTAIKGFADLFSPDSDAFTHMEAVARGNLFPLRLYRTAHSYPRADGTVLPGHRDGNRRGPEGNVYLPRPQGPFPDLCALKRPPGSCAYIESGRSGDAVTKLFTIGPMFRYERPQKGRMRQFHQINCECPRAFRTLRGRRTGHDGHALPRSAGPQGFEPPAQFAGLSHMPSRLPRDAAQVALRAG